VEIRQYEVVLVNLDPTMGTEIKKTRPCVVISPDEMNKNLRTITIAPMTSSSRPYPTRVEVNQNGQSGWIVLDQIRTVDKLRVVKKFESLTEREIRNCKRVIKETYVD
jgi:mRNA interferase MazF